MTTCGECLTELSSVKLADLRADSPVVVHYSECARCRSVADDLFYAENRLATALSEVRPTSTPDIVAANAIRGSEQRRRTMIARGFRLALIIAGAGLVPLAAEVIVGDDGPPHDSRIVETMTLSCITAAQAAEMASPYLRSDGSSVVIHDEELRTITLQGVADEVVAARIRIDELEDAGTCTIGTGGSGSNAPAASGTPVQGELAPLNPLAGKQERD